MQTARAWRTTLWPTRRHIPPWNKEPSRLLLLGCRSNPLLPTQQFHEPPAKPPLQAQGKGTPIARPVRTQFLLSRPGEEEVSLSTLPQGDPAVWTRAQGSEMPELHLVGRRRRRVVRESSFSKPQQTATRKSSGTNSANPCSSSTGKNATG